MAYTVICRSDGPPYRFDAYPFNNFPDADRFAVASDCDFVIEELSHGVVPSAVVKYRLGDFVMG